MRRALLPLAVTLGVLVLCSIPGTSIPPVRLFTADKLAHIVMFAVFAWAWLRAYPDKALWIFGGGVAFAVFTEIWQDTLPIGRTGEAADAVADIIGLAIVAGVWFIQSRRSHTGERASA